MYRISDAGFPESVLSMITITDASLEGKLEKDSPFKGAKSEKPCSFKVKEFIRFSEMRANLTLPIGEYS